MTFKERLIDTIEDNQLEMLVPSREYTENEVLYMSGYTQALQDMLDDYNSDIYNNRHDFTNISLN
jgi:hypothetical protein